ncbi:MAG TPA: hypothetical protein VHB99_00590 [Pirellulales bacterium]|nr:hypothetical protein [Pirellulales bacterium]
MRFQARTFWLSKDADEPEQFQDAFELDAERGIAAIADGVSSAIFSGPWARVLTHEVVVEPPNLEDTAAFQDWLARGRAAWSSQIDVSKLTWYQRPKMVDGAMTTLLWVELHPVEVGEDGLAKSYRLRTFAIGDTCLFHLRDGETLARFPLENSTEFGLNPAVIASIDRKRDHLLAFNAAEADCLPGDLLVLCTDAIALWAYECAEAGEPVAWEEYWDLDAEAWRDEIFSLRDAARMRFDDSTLVLLRVIEETPAPPPEAEGTPETTPDSALAAAENSADELAAGALDCFEEDELAPSIDPAPEDIVEPVGFEEAVEPPLELNEVSEAHQDVAPTDPLQSDREPIADFEPPAADRP